MIPLKKDTAIKVYASPRVSEALAVIKKDLTLYQGVRLFQILDAVYQQGLKDGARLAFEETQRKFTEAQKAVPHRLPGRPRKKPRL